MPPMFVHLYTFIHSLYIHTPPYLFIHPLTPHMFVHPHMSPMLPYASLCCRGYLHVIWDWGPHMLDSPLWGSGCLPMCPTFHVCSPVYLYILWDNCMFYGQDTSCWGDGGVSMSVRLLVSVSTYIGCPLCSSHAFL